MVHHKIGLAVMVLHSSDLELAQGRMVLQMIDQLGKVLHSSGLVVLQQMVLRMTGLVVEMVLRTTGLA